MFNNICNGTLNSICYIKPTNHQLCTNLIHFQNDRNMYPQFLFFADYSVLKSVMEYEY